MLTMAVGQSDEVDPDDAIHAAIDQCRASLAELVPQAAILFVTFDAFDPSMVAAVRAEFPGIAVVGSTSSAEMSSAGGYREDSVALSLIAADAVDLTAGVGSGVEADLEGASRAAVEQAMAQTDKAPKLCVLFTDGIDGQRALEAVRRALPEDVVVVGGGASGVTLSPGQQNFKFYNDSVVEDGLVLLLFSGSLAYSFSVGTGLRPIGPQGTVTRSDYGVIHEIGGRPAGVFVAEYVNVSGPATFGNPLAVREEGSPDWYLRVMLSQDAATGSLRITGTAPEGSVVQLTSASADEVVAAAGDSVRRARAAFPTGATPSAALFFSCATRKFLLGTRTGQELAAARSLLPADTPVVGMYCTGEIAPVGSGPASRFLNESFVTVLLGG